MKSQSMQFSSKPAVKGDTAIIGLTALNVAPGLAKDLIKHTNDLVSIIEDYFYRCGVADGFADYDTNKAETESLIYENYKLIMQIFLDMDEDQSKNLVSNGSKVFGNDVSLDFASIKEIMKVLSLHNDYSDEMTIAPKLCCKL